MTTTSSALRLLVAEDSEDDFEILLRELRRGGYVVGAERVATAAQLRVALAAEWDLVISDWSMPGFGGLEVLQLLAEAAPHLPCMMISGTLGEEPAVLALRAGALDFLSKDKPKRFVPAVQRALREADDRRGRLAFERELQISEERYRMGFEVAPEPLLTVDLERYAIVDANSKAQQLFKRSRAELRALALGELSPPTQPDGRPSVEAARAHIAAALAGASTPFTWTYQAGGESIPTLTRIDHLPTTGRNLAQIQIQDLRERLRSEEIRRRSADLERQNRRIQEANRLKSEFLANMSHELRTPLNAIIGFAELLYDGRVPADAPEHKEFLGDILTSGRHLLQLINDILDLAKVEAGKLEFRPEPVDLEKLLAEVTAIVRTTAAAKRLYLTTEIDPRVREAVLDPARFKQIAYNYLSNALKFTGPEGRVTIRITPEGDDRFRLAVEDTGVGIAAEDLNRLFLEFHQLESGAAKRHQGTGLGLALTRRLVEAQGGEVGVTSTPGQGSTFHAVLPRRVTVTSTAVARAAPAAIHGARTVLVVEDDVRDQEQLVGALEAAGYNVEIARTGAEALERWRARRFDAVTIDLLLPDMSGIELLSALQGERNGGEVPIIVVTVVPDSRLVSGFAVHDVLHKPLDGNTLLASLARAGVQVTAREDA